VQSGSISIIELNEKEGITHDQNINIMQNKKLRLNYLLIDQTDETYFFNQRVSLFVT
jgi:hypothetical protein